MATKDGTDGFVKSIDFEEKLINVYKKITSNKTRHIEVRKKRHALSKNVKLILTKGLTKILI